MSEKSTWNRRVIRHENGTLAIHEVYYLDGVARAWSTHCTEEADCVQALRDFIEATYQQSLAALDRPFLEVGDFPAKSQ